jgi:hypothetical protein
LEPWRQSKRRKGYPSDPTPVRRSALALEILILFANPLVVILLFASLVSAIADGHKVEFRKYV